MTDPSKRIDDLLNLAAPDSGATPPERDTALRTVRTLLEKEWKQNPPRDSAGRLRPGVCFDPTQG
jgi:hypothetical protein